MRRALLSPLEAHLKANEDAMPVTFFEVAPENWIDVGGPFGRRLRAFTERFPLVCHGLSLNLGGNAPLDMEFVGQVKRFLLEHGAQAYTEHLSACADDGHLYDLMPVPFTEEAARHAAERIARVQDALGQRIGVENISCYAAPGQEISELEFINAVVAEADCLLLLDVNNIYVNSVNFGYDPSAFLRGLPGERAAYLHVAGHRREAPDLCVDSHGAAIIDPVWRLLAEAYERFGPLPTVVERDFNLPPLPELLAEARRVRDLQAGAAGHAAAEAAFTFPRRATAPAKPAEPDGAAAVKRRDTQRRFAAYIRHPERHPPPADVPEARMRLYARLFHNNVESFLAETFTVLRAITPAEGWNALTRDFLRRHRATSPYFSHIPEEFLEYLGGERPGGPAVPPFALELCHYQWARLALRLAPDVDCVFDDAPVTVDDDLTVSPLAWPLRYEYPVDRIGPGNEPAAPPPTPTFLIARRGRRGEVRFIRANAMNMRLLQLLEEGRAPGASLKALAAETGRGAELVEAGLRALNRLHKQDIVLRRTHPAER